jgi:hypothetical protein
MSFLKKLFTWFQAAIAWIGTFGSSLDKVAQAGHVLAGYAIVLTFGLLPFPHAALWGAFAVLGVWGLPKEFYVDVVYEHASYEDGLNDWLHYLYGAGAALLVAVIRFRAI